MNVYIFIVAVFLATAIHAQCPPINDRIDCHPEDGADLEKCEARGCCWEKTRMPLPGEPSCFFPTNYDGYRTLIATEIDSGLIVFMVRNDSSVYPDDVPLLRIDVEYQTDYIVRIKITDAVNTRFEAPFPSILKPPGGNSNQQYSVSFTQNKPGFQVSRREGGPPLFDADFGAFIYSNQFIQISTPIIGKLFGIGEARTNISITPGWKRFTLFNNGGYPRENANLYGSHPFYIVTKDDGTAHGVFLHNSNAMDVLLSPKPSVTFRAIGGILDLYFFLGPSPTDVVKQYTSLVGRTLLPPYWSLGFHLCRYGYGSSNNTRVIWQRNRDIEIPFDVQWTDIDSMHTQNDFTIDPERFADLPELVSDIHKAGMRYVPILDPGVSASEPEGTYEPYDLGIKMDIFVKHENGSNYIGKVWNPVSTAFPDFTHPNATAYWSKLVSDYHDIVPFDGIWIDMNEPSNFYDGTPEGCSDNKLDNPPYRTGVLGDKLAYQTLCMTAKLAAGSHYDVHNLYSIAEAEVTYNSLIALGKRPFVLSRSTYSGSGRYTGHWSGDDAASWSDLRQSIQELLTFNMYGVSLMGADVCGFRENTTPELCNRWFQLGSFYTFTRNHNDLAFEHQDPAVFDKTTVDSIRKSLNQRYTLLPYLYTLFYQSHTDGSPVAKPLFFEFPEDESAYDVETAFMWGNGLYIIPVLESGADKVTNYLPGGRWYDWYSGIGRNSTGEYVTFDAPYDVIPLLIKGGAILPTQAPATTTTISRNNGMTIIAALDENGNAEGALYWDDGEVIDPVLNELYGLLNFTVKNNRLNSVVQKWNSTHTPKLEAFKILGVKSVNTVLVNGATATYQLENDVLSITELSIPLNTDINVSWS